jgi:hypothetical protein
MPDAAEVLKAIELIGKILAAFASIVASVVAILLWQLRKKYVEDMLDIRGKLEEVRDELSDMNRIRECLATIARKYRLNITHEQAVNLLDMAYGHARLNIKCWVCRYITAGHPDFNKGKWNLRALINGEYYATISKLEQFAFEGTPLSTLIKKEEFDWLFSELKDVVGKYDNPLDASERVTSEIENMLIMTKKRMNQEPNHD